MASLGDGDDDENPGLRGMRLRWLGKRKLEQPDRDELDAEPVGLPALHEFAVPAHERFIDPLAPGLEDDPHSDRSMHRDARA